MLNLLTIVSEVVKKSGGAKKIAPLVGVSSPELLLNQLCETNCQHKLGAETLRQIIQICQPHAIKIVQLLAADVESVIVRLPAPSKEARALMPLVLKTGEMFGKVSETLMNSIDPDGEDGVFITLGEFEEIEMVIFEANQAFQELLAKARELSDQHANRPKLSPKIAQQHDQIINQDEPTWQGGNP